MAVSSTRRDCPRADQQRRLILADEPVASLEPRLAATSLACSATSPEEEIPVIVEPARRGSCPPLCRPRPWPAWGELVFAGPATTITEKEVHEIYGTDTDLEN